MTVTGNNSGELYKREAKSNFIRNAEKSRIKWRLAAQPLARKGLTGIHK